MVWDLGNFAPALILISRNGFGWLENSLKDGKLTWPEVTQLGVTLLRLAPQFIFFFFGIQADPTQAAALAVGSDVGLHKLVKLVDAVKKK